MGEIATGNQLIALGAHITLPTSEEILPLYPWILCLTNDLNEPTLAVP